MRKPKQQRGFIYFLLSEKMNAVKIGFTRGGIEERLVSANTWSPYDYDVLKVLEGTMLEECQLHKTFAMFRIRGEWFEYTDELKKFIESL